MLCGVVLVQNVLYLSMFKLQLDVYILYFLFVIYKNETKRTYVKDISITKTDWFDMLYGIYKLFIEIFIFFG